MQSYRYLPVLLLFSSALAYADAASGDQKADKISQLNAPRGVPVEMLADPEDEEVVADQPYVVSTIEVSKEDVVEAEKEAESQEKQADSENVDSDNVPEASVDESSNPVVEEKDVEVKIDVQPLETADSKEESNSENEGAHALREEVQEPLTESSSNSVETAEHLPSNAVDAAQKQENVNHTEEHIVEASQKENNTPQEEIVAQQEQTEGDVKSEEPANIASQEEDESLNASEEDQDVESEEAEASVDEDAVDSDEPQVDEPDLAAIEENFKEELKQVFNQGVEELLKKYPQLNKHFNGTFNIHYTYISPEKDDQEQEVEKAQ